MWQEGRRRSTPTLGKDPPRVAGIIMLDGRACRLRGCRSPAGHPCHGTLFRRPPVPGEGPLSLNARGTSFDIREEAALRAKRDDINDAGSSRITLPGCRPSPYAPPQVEAKGA